MTRILRLSFFNSLAKNRELLWRLSEREITGRYRGSVLGWGWSLVNPVLMLGVYTLVFSTVFKAQWGNVADSGPLGFAVNLFAGLITFTIFAECANQAPTLILSNANYVKKVIFPLELLGAVTVATAVFHALTSMIVLLAFELIALQAIPITVLFIPIVWLPLALGCLALSWILSALGVFIRDLSQVINVSVSMLMFLSAVFYPLSALPPKIAGVLRFNPLALVVEQSRKVLVDGSLPNATFLLAWIAGMLIVCEISYRLFRKAGRGFGDVI